jgi:hypothetical protein
MRGQAQGGREQPGCSIVHAAKAIAFQLSWQENVLYCRKDSIEASFVTGHDFSRAAKRSPKEAGL